ASDADRLGLTPMLALRSWAVTGCGPEIMGIGPVSASAAALERAGLTLDDIDLIGLNEAFAAQVLAVLAEWKVDPLDDRVNPNGSGISLGHPIGATGARILATAAYEARRRNARTVLETMCIGGGQGLAAVFEVVRCAPAQYTPSSPAARMRRWWCCPTRWARPTGCGMRNSPIWSSDSGSCVTTPARGVPRPCRPAPIRSTIWPTTSSHSSTVSVYSGPASSA